MILLWHSVQEKEAEEQFSVQGGPSKSPGDFKG